jgi:hypothetical protein
VRCEFHFPEVKIEVDIMTREDYIASYIINE